MGSRDCDYEYLNNKFPVLYSELLRKVCAPHCPTTTQAGGENPGATQDVQPRREWRMGGMLSVVKKLFLKNFWWVGGEKTDIN